MPRSTRSSRTTAGVSSSSATRNSKRRKTTRQKQTEIVSSEGEGDDLSLHSDALDDDDDDDPTSRKATKSPKRKPKTSPKKKRKRSEAEESEEDGVELKDGQEIVGVVVKAPVNGRVPPGRISQNTLDFLNRLKDPKCNDREWFKLHEPVYRLAEQEWKDFIDEFTALLTEVDPQIPPLPTRDVIHRIYRDIRFSNDKTPYKRSFSASFSRTGRKGHFAHYHISIKPGGESLIAAGAWCPGKDNLATIRNNIQHNSAPLRDIISAPEFVKHFGEPKPHPDGLRRNIFGLEDELKVAPKGVDKSHKDIDLLKCRTFAVVYHFSDEQVLAPDFKEELARMSRLLRPFVHCMNDLMTLRDESEGPEDEE